jgi:tight adherence protein B
MALLIALLTFVVATAACLLILFSFSRSDRQEIIQRRIEAVQKVEGHGTAAVGVELVRDETMSSVPLLNRVLLRWSWSARFKEFARQAGVDTRPGKVFLVSAVLAVLGYLFASAAHAGFPLPLLVGVVLGASPMAYIALKRRKRLRQFEENFPEALDLLNRAVRAGHAFTTGLGMIATEASEPLAGEFRTTFEEQNFGLPLRDALQNLAERVPLIDVRFFVTALLIQKETGGNLTEILENLAHVIRDRFRIYRDARSKSAHGRLTAGILILLPVAMVVALGTVNPNYVRVLYGDPLGLRILWGAAVWQVIGAFLLWRIVKIEV